MARRRPYLGEGIFRYYANPQDFDEKLERCDKALRIAAKFERKDLANETRVVLSYIQLAKWLYYVADRVATDDLSTLGGQATLRDFLMHLDDAGKENATAIKEWRSALGSEPWHYRVHAIVMDTLMGKGVPLFEQREKAHFIRVDSGEWEQARKELEGEQST